MAFMFREVMWVQGLCVEEREKGCGEDEKLQEFYNQTDISVSLQLSGGPAFATCRESCSILISHSFESLALAPPSSHALSEVKAV